MNTDTDALLAMVREALLNGGHRGSCRIFYAEATCTCGVGTALDSLAAELKTLRRHPNVEAWRIADERAEQYRAELERMKVERDAALARNATYGPTAEEALDAAEDELERMKAERDSHIERADKLLEGYVKTQGQGAELLDDLDKALTALRKIAKGDWPAYDVDGGRDIARAAIAEIEGEE